MTILLIDFNNLSIRNVFMEKEMINNPNPDFGLHKHAVIQSILFNIKKFSPNEVILGVDDNNCWRKKIYPEYKAHRKDKKDNDIFPWDKYYSYIAEYTQELKNNFPFKFIQSPYAEADDVIAVLCKHLIRDKKIVVTADSDYIQLLDLPDVKLYNPLTEKFIVDENPLRTMEIKIVAGDAGDNIPNIKPRIGPKTAEKLILNGELSKFIDENNLLDNYTRNTQLISFSHIPMTIQKKILETYYSYKTPETMDLFNFFVRHRLRHQLENISVTKQILKPIKQKIMEKEFDLFCQESGGESL